MKRPPLPRKDVYPLFWKFAAERQSAFENRVAGEQWPWSDDRIIQTFKFCNVYRAADRVSQFMIRDVCYHWEQNTPADRIFQIFAFRTFSKIETWQAVRESIGRNPTLVDLADGTFSEALEYAKVKNGGLYTGAFILCATDAFGKQLKHLNHVELFKRMFLEDQVSAKILEAASLKDIYDLLHQYPLMGDFMSYQIAIDLNYSEHVNFSENDFTQAGPGALRGIKKCFESLGDYSPAEVIQWMVEHQDEEFARYGLPFAGLWGRKLHAIDCQNVFCETDKYCRQAVPELASARKRIKSKFKPKSDPVQLYFPPKWGINDRIPSIDMQRADPIDTSEPHQATLFNI